MVADPADASGGGCRRKKLAGDAGYRDLLWIVKNGVPWDLAETWTDEQVLAASIVLGELEGGARFNWDSFQWENIER